MVLFDGNHIALDMIGYFAVGRLYKKDRIHRCDSLAWIVPSLGAAFGLSMLASHSNSLHHSLTAYEMHCSWTWQFKVLLLFGALPTIVILVGAHFRYAHQQQQAALQKLVELSLGLGIFLLPYVGNAFFHLHHWYYAWMLGMHANFPVWWSQLTMSVMWGVYMNGIALFGRDPVMTCAVSLYQSQNQQCPFVSDDFTGLMNTGFTNTVGTSFDWHNCSDPSLQIFAEG